MRSSLLGKAPVLLLAACPFAAAEDILWPVNTAYTFQFALYSGTAMITGASPSASVYRVDDQSSGNHWWSGTAWQSSYTTVLLTEQTGNVGVEGEYAYTLGSSAVGTTVNTFRFSCKYVGTVTVYNKKVLNTYLPAVGTDGRAMVSANTHMSGQTVAGVTNGVTLAADQPVNVTKVGGVSQTGADLGGFAGKFTFSGSGPFYPEVDLRTWLGTAPLALSFQLVQTSGGGLTLDQAAELDEVFAGLGTTQVTVNSPVSLNAAIDITQGDDYPAGTLPVTVINWPRPSIVGGSASFTLYSGSTLVVVIGPVNCTFTNGTTGSDVTFSIPLTHAQTTSLTGRSYRYSIVARTSGGNQWTPVDAPVNVHPRVQN